jgi:hypothetical protein
MASEGTKYCRSAVMVCTSPVLSSPMTTSASYVYVRGRSRLRTRQFVNGRNPKMKEHPGMVVNARKVVARRALSMQVQINVMYDVVGR